MKFILVSPKNRTVYNFRGELIKDLINKGYEVIVTGPNLIDVEKIEKLGARFELISLEKNGLNPFSDLKYYKKLKKIFIKEKPDVVLSYTIKPVIYGSIAAKKAKVKNINAMITGAGYLFVSNTFKAKVIKFFAKKLYKYGLNGAHNIIFQNQDDLNEFVENKIVKIDKCKLVNGSGVNMNHFQPVDFPDKITFFMLSRIMKSKGVIEYLQAAKIIKFKYPEVRFYLLGAFENIQDSISYDDIKEYVDSNIVKIFGETDDVRKFFKDSSVFVLPSYREGTPRTVLEAMAMGRPIITTNAPGCKDTVIHGKTGFLVEPKNVDQLVNAMEQFIKDKELISIMGQNSYEYCREKYDVRKINNKMFENMNL